MPIYTGNEINSSVLLELTKSTDKVKGSQLRMDVKDICWIYDESYYGIQFGEKEMCKNKEENEIIWRRLL